MFCDSALAHAAFNAGIFHADAHAYLQRARRARDPRRRARLVGAARMTWHDYLHARAEVRRLIRRHARRPRPG